MNRLSALTIAVERTLLGASVAVVLLLHFGGWLLPAWAVSALPLSAEIRQLLPASQIVLLAAWLVSGLGPLWLRLATTPVLLCTWASVWTDAGGQWLLLAGLMTALLGLGLRCFGLRVSVATERSTPPAIPRHPQFSLGALILLTTLIAVALGTLEILRPSLQAQTELSRVLEEVTAARLNSDPLAEFLVGITPRSVVMASALAIVALASMFAVLRSGPVWLRLLVTAVLVPALGIYLVNLTGGETAETISLTLGMTLLSAIVAVSVWPLRMAEVQLIGRTGRLSNLTRMNAEKLKACSEENSHEPRTAAA